VLQISLGVWVKRCTQIYKKISLFLVRVKALVGTQVVPCLCADLTRLDENYAKHISPIFFHLLLFSSSNACCCTHSQTPGPQNTNSKNADCVHTQFIGNTNAYHSGHKAPCVELGCNRQIFRVPCGADFTFLLVRG